MHDVPWFGRAPAPLAIELRAAELAARVLCGASPIRAMSAAEYGGWLLPDAHLYGHDHEAGRLARYIVPRSRGGR